MDRRTFIAIVVGSVLAIPFAEAQQAEKTHRVGVLTGGSEAGSQSRLEALRKALRELGYVGDRSITWEYRYSNDTYDRLPALAAELVRLNVSAIIANGTPASLAAQEATNKIPIVIFETADPVGSKLVLSLAKPGGNITGVAQLVSFELFGKQFEMLKEILPHLRRAGLLFNPANPVQQTVLNSAQVAAQTLAITVQALAVSNPSEFETGLANATRNGVGAIIVTRDNVFVDHIPRLVDLSARYRMPTMYGSRPFASAGGLIAYGPDPADSAQRAAAYLDKILKGTRPADLPVEQPTKFELVINLKAAKALGVTIPQSILLRADQVIE